MNGIWKRMALVAALVLSAINPARAASAVDVPAFLSDHFPSGLTDVDGNAVSLESLKGKAIGLYFSAHWCPPCRAFTPKLVQYRDANSANFEVVFVSSDQTAEAQTDYMKETKMKFARVAWRSDAANALAEKYKVTGIPMLILLRPDGTVYATDGRSFVSAGKDIAEVMKAAAAAEPASAAPATKVVAAAAAVPAAAEPAPAVPVDQMTALRQHFPEGVVNAAGEAVDLNSLKGKVVGIYYSAHWCGPCRQFTPKLVEYRNKYKDNFEVVFVSSDRSEEEQANYIKEVNMPWLALKFRSEASSKLGERYQVRGIPALVLLGADGALLTREGRALVTDGADMVKLQAGAFTRETQEYKCDRCDKTHTREKILVQ